MQSSNIFPIFLQCLFHMPFAVIWECTDYQKHLEKLTERVRYAIANTEDPHLDECRKWSLVWVVLNMVAPLEPDEMEFLLGYPKEHTWGISRTERYRSLGNSFQVDTIAYVMTIDYISRWKGEMISDVPFFVSSDCCTQELQIS
ncbi:DNA (cytosine-5)-methyltransferase DRM2-like [Phragmites australis]|uniref:DNA (cytosine-5)-methyltransferase DRM2-like n=1 Tax=Phragmites australis TaxID=29695 RepID=UPI002D79F9C6|nr:DNA (cytosine-5)-methyltransferase DRM2-like [Phragmites australis]